MTTLARLLRWLFGRDSSGNDIESPSFTVEENEVQWACHVCETKLKVPLQRNGTAHTECPECGTSRTITDGILDPPKGTPSKDHDMVFVTQATLKELRAERQEIPDVDVRNRLVYHENRDCAFAHKDFEVDGTLVAYNTGVVETEYKRELSFCKPCAGVELEPCDRCNGRGNIPRYSHVRDGICFKCGGDGYLERHPDDKD